MTLSVESCLVSMGRFRPVPSVLVRWVHGGGLYLIGHKRFFFSKIDDQ